MYTLATVAFRSRMAMKSTDKARPMQRSIASFFGKKDETKVANTMALEPLQNGSRNIYTKANPSDAMENSQPTIKRKRLRRSNAPITIDSSGSSDDGFPIVSETKGPNPCVISSDSSLKHEHASNNTIALELPLAQSLRSCQDNDIVSYGSLALLFSQIEQVSSRLLIQDLMTAFFRNVIQHSPQDLIACIYLCIGSDLAPPYENIKIGVGDAILIKAIGEATGTNAKFIKEMYQKEGDLGQVAQKARSKQNTLHGFTNKAKKDDDRLSVQDVYSHFYKIAKMTGNQSQQQKCSMIKYLLVRCQKETENHKGDGQMEAAKYIIRGLQGKLRIGLADKSILMGLTYAFMREKDFKDRNLQQEALRYVKKAFSECSSFHSLVNAFLQAQKKSKKASNGSVWLASPLDFKTIASLCVLTPGIPVAPMLARPTKSYNMVFDRFENKPFTCEYKYDGERAQIHLLTLSDENVCIFSRNFENTTERFPDVKAHFLKAAVRGSLENCIIDAEVVAFDRKSGKRLPFQVLSTRSRKNVSIEDIKVPVCVYAFDLLYLNGESLLSQPLSVRRSKLRELLTEISGNFEFVDSMDVEQFSGADDADALEQAVDQIRQYLQKATDENCEGLMIKTLQEESTYEPANRSHKWLKVKKDYLDGIGDSTDLVPIGAFHGRGKRTGVYGAYLLACYDPESEMYQCITKLGTGLSDEKLKELYTQLQCAMVDKVPREYAVTDGIKPDVWFEPSCVWEILGADLSISPKYTAAMGLIAESKGISLRFPRFIRARDDKDPTQATTAAQIADLYRGQNLATVSNEEEDDMLI